MIIIKFKVNFLFQFLLNKFFYSVDRVLGHRESSESKSPMKSNEIKESHIKLRCNTTRFNFLLTF
jgi:hypothetical protein